ncbi:MAG: hypothetical protein ACRC8W_19835 [Plesiomonas shigelloides]
MRKNGWYRVRFDDDEGWILVNYNPISDIWCSGAVVYWEEDFAEIDPQMVMTPNGEIVYHNAQHDPLYNTAQEQ